MTVQPTFLKLCSAMCLLGLAGTSFSEVPASSAPSASSLPVSVNISASPRNQTDPSLSDQINQLHGVVDTLVQEQSQVQNELSLLQQRVLQLEAQNELARSKVSREGERLAEGTSAVTSNVPTSPATSAPNSAENADLYVKAYGLINEGEYKKAEAELQAYLLAEPKGEYAADSHYWLGEINMVNAQSDVAAKEFRMVIEAFPGSDKAPASMRELGEIFLANGDSQHAKQILQKVVKQYPDTAAAVLAQKTLDTM